MTKQEKIKFKELKRQHDEILTITRLFCSECLGHFSSGYGRCTDPVCPLFFYFPTKGQLKEKKFIQRVKDLEKSRAEQS